MTDFVWFCGVSCLAIFAQAFSGFGGGLIAVPLLVMRLDPRAAIPAYSLMQMGICLLLLLEAHQHVEWRRMAKWLLAAVPGAPLGSYILRTVPTHWIALGVSVITLAFGIVFLLKVRFRLRDTLPTNFSVGLLSGVLGGCVSQSGPPVVIFSLSQGAARDTFRATLLAYFFCQSCLSAGSHIYFGLLRWDNAKIAAFGILPSALAAALGALAKHRTNEATFRLAVLLMVVAVSLLNLGQKLFW